MNHEGMLISGSEDKLVKIWDRNYNCILTMEGHDDFSRVICGISKNLIASGGNLFNCDLQSY